MRSGFNILLTRTRSDDLFWEVIVNGDAPAIASASTKGPIPPKAAKQKLTRKNELKAKRHIVVCSHIPVISQDDANLKLLRSLPLAWNNIALIMRNKSDLETMSMDDLYNNLKVYVAEIKSQSSSMTSTNSQNVVFCITRKTQATLMKPSIHLDNEDLERIDTNDLEEKIFKWQVGHLTMRVKRDHKKRHEGESERQWQRTSAPRIQGNRNIRCPRIIVPERTPPNAKIVQDGSYQFHQVQTLRLKSDQGIFDSECSRHMTGNKSYLTDYQDIDRGFVAFTGSPKRDSSKVTNHLQAKGSRFIQKGIQQDSLGKFDGKADEGFLVGYSINSKAFRVFNTRTRKVEENLHINLLESKPNVAGSGPKWLFDIDSLTESMNYELVTARNQTNSDAGIETNVNAGQAGQEKASDHEYILLPLMLFNSPLSSTEFDNLLVQQKEGYANNTNRASTVNPSVSTAGQGFDNVDDQERIDRITQDVNIVGPTTGIFDDAYDDREEVGAEADLNNLVTTMNELLQFKLQKVWTLVDLPKGKRAIGTKWVYRNKKDERGIVVRNKAKLVAQGYTQEEGIDYDDVFSLVARIEAMRLILANASFMRFIVYQMDVKSAFLYGTIKEEVYVCQPLGFEDPQFPDKVYKIEKALYGLHQAPRSWYETLSTYLLENRFRRGTIDKTLFIKKDRGDILLVQVYVDDIIFGFTKKSFCVEFEQMMHKRFQISSMGELTFFLGLQIQQKEDGIFISQDKYVADILKKFDFTTVKITSTLIETNKALNKDEEAEDVDVHLYRSMIGSLMYLTASRPDIMFDVCAYARFHVFTNMRKPGKGSSGTVTPLFQNMLVPPVVVGEGSEKPLKPQPTPSTAPPEVLSQVTTAAASQLSHPQTGPGRNTILGLSQQPLKDPNTYRRTKRGRNTKVPQTGGSPNKVGDEAINEEIFDSVERTATTASSLEAEHASYNINKTQFTATLNDLFFLKLGSGHTLGSGEDNMEHQIELTDNIPNTPHDSPLPGVNTPGSDEGSLELNKLMDLVTKLSRMVFDLEKVKTAQAKEIAGLKRRVTKLEQRQRSRILKNHPFRFEDAFNDIDDLVDEGMAFVQEKDVENQGKIGADDTEVVKGSGDTKVFDTEKAVNTAGEGVSTTSIPETLSTAALRTPPTTTIFDDEDVTMTMAQTLIKIKKEKAKEKGVVIKDVEDSSRSIRSITTLQPLPTIYPKYKEKLDEELRVERERQEEASKVAIAEMFDEVQARMYVDYELAARMTQEEQEKYTIEERDMLLAEFFERRKKQLAAKRAEAIRNKPPTKTQLRNLMMTYLKNMGGYKHSQLKGKSYEEIQGLYERQQKRIQDITPMDSEKEAQKPGKRLKRVAGSYATQKSPKKPKVMKSAKDVTEEEAVEYEKEKEELRLSLKIISNDDSEVDHEPLSRKFPIVN
ncbi:putative ribonuclease H-like domain-containing protein [Tanacetum coccineum]